MEICLFFFFQSEEKICGFSTIFTSNYFAAATSALPEQHSRVLNGGSLIQRRFLPSVSVFPASPALVSERGESDVSIVCSAAVMTLIVALPDDICHQKVTD